MAVRIGILNPDGLTRCTQIALELLEEKFKEQRIEILYSLYTSRIPEADILVGTYEKSPLIRDLTENGRLPLEKSPESLVISEISREGKPALLVGGYDDRGLSYALYELADRVGSQSLLALYNPVAEKPFLAHREVVAVLSHADLGKKWFSAPEYWRDYFSTLARRRFNTFTLLFEDWISDLASFFPYFLAAKDFPEVRVEGLSPTERERKRKTLISIGRVAEEYGVDFHLGFRGLENVEVMRGWSQERSPAKGMTAENLELYAYSALKRLIFDCPEIKGIQVRCSGKAGIKFPVEEDLLIKTIARVIAEGGNRIKLKLGGMEVPAAAIKDLAGRGLPLYLAYSYDYRTGATTLPYLPTELLPVGPGDLRPKEQGLKSQKTASREVYRVYHELGRYGPYRILPWGDPEYIRGFVRSLKEAGSSGFAVYPPPARNGLGNKRGKRGFLSRDNQYYKWEFERYWYFYLLFGRLGYNPGTGGDVLIRDFHRKFGEKGADLADLYHLAGKVMDLYLTAHRSGPETGLRPEIDTGGLLDFYYRSSPADPEVFSSFQEYIKECLDGEPSGRISPVTVAERLEDLGRVILDKVKEVGFPAKGEEEQTGERRISLIDLSIMGYLALYHACKFRAAVHLGFYYEIRDLSSLLRAVRWLRAARKNWESITGLTEGIYAHRMLGGPAGSGDSGDWQSKLPLLIEDEKRLEIMIREYRENGYILKGFDFGGACPVNLDESGASAPILSDHNGERGHIHISRNCRYSPDKGYGWLTTTGIVKGDKPTIFRVDLAPGTYRLRIILCDRSLRPTVHGPMTIKANGRVMAENLTVPTGKKVVFSEVMEITGRLELELAALPGGDWFISALNIMPAGPVIAHAPAEWGGEGPLAIEASVTGADEIKEVLLHYRCPEDSSFRTAPMNLAHPPVYRAELPGILQGKTVFYFITAADSRGRFALNDNSGRKFILRPGESVPSLFHTPPLRIIPYQKLNLALTVVASSANDIRQILLCYRPAPHQQGFSSIVMAKEGTKFSGEVAGEELRPGLFLQYFFKVITESGKGYLFPDPFRSTPFFLVKMADES